MSITENVNENATENVTENVTAKVTNMDAAIDAAIEMDISKDIHADSENLGRFTLPTSAASDAQSSSGASLAGWDASDESAADIHDDFPMIVWLRGDEPWFQQFDMDAEAVMNALGIKRSRLTQIAGKELRVGRVRVDRYVRPVFRRTDVEQYLSWTRATASHQKSSDAIKIAVDQLGRQSDLIQKTLDDVTLRFTEEIKVDLHHFISGAVSDGVTPIQQRIKAIEIAIQERVQALEENLTQSSRDFASSAQSVAASIQEFSRGQAAALEAITLQMNQTSEKTAIMEERLNIWDQMLSSHMKMIAQDLESLKQPAPFKAKRTKKRRRPTPSATQDFISGSKPLLQKRHAPARRKPS
jgi:hypothetical protein